MFFSNILRIAKHRKPVLASLALVGVTAGLFTLSRTTDPGEDEISCTLLEEFGKPINALVFSADSKTLATGDGWVDRTGEVKLWDVDAGTEPALIGEYPNAIVSLAFSPDGRILAFGCHDGTVKLRDLLLCQDSVVFQNSEACQYQVAFSLDGRILATWGAKNYLHMRDMTTGDEQTIEGIRGPVAFCPDDHPLGIARFHNVTICDALKGQKLLTLRADTHALWTIVFSPDGRIVAAAAHDGTVTVWDANSGAQRMTLPGHQDLVNAVVFSADGKMLASGSFDGTVKLWAAGTGEELACLHGHTRAVTALAYAPDGRKIASGSHDQTVRVWHLGNRWNKIGR
jgi:WD40 repeat protein